MRALDRLLAVVSGLGLAWAGAMLAVEAVLLQAGRPAWLIPRDQWDQNLRTVSWDDTDTKITCIVLIVVGTLLLVGQLVPRRPLRFRLWGRSGRTVSLSRRSLQRRLDRMVTQDPDVASGRVRVGRRRARIDVGVAPSVDQAALSQRLNAVGSQTVEHLGLVRQPRLRFRYRAAKTRVQ